MRVVAAVVHEGGGAKHQHRATGGEVTRHVGVERASHARGPDSVEQQVRAQHEGEVAVPAPARGQQHAEETHRARDGERRGGGWHDCKRHEAQQHVQRRHHLQAAGPRKEQVGRDAREQQPERGQRSVDPLQPEPGQAACRRTREECDGGARAAQPAAELAPVLPALQRERTCHQRPGHAEREQEAVEGRELQRGVDADEGDAGDDDHRAEDAGPVLDETLLELVPPALQFGDRLLDRRGHGRCVRRDRGLSRDDFRQGRDGRLRHGRRRRLYGFLDNRHRRWRDRCLGCRGSLLFEPVEALLGLPEPMPYVAQRARELSERLAQLVVGTPPASPRQDHHDDQDRPEQERNHAEDQADDVHHGLSTAF